MNYAHPRSELFGVFNALLLGIIAVITLYPFLYVLSVSLSSAAEAERQSLHLVAGRLLVDAVWALFRLDGSAAAEFLHAYLDGCSLTAYRMVLASREVLVGFGKSIFRTVLGAVVALLASAMAAYPLSRMNVKQAPATDGKTTIVPDTENIPFSHLPGKQVAPARFDLRPIVPERGLNWLRQ